MSGEAAPRRTFSLGLRTIVSIGLCLVVLVCAVAGFAALASLKKPAIERSPDERIYNVEVFRLERVDLQEYIVAFGTARADREVVLSAQVSGTVTGLHPDLRVGSTVQADRLRNADYTSANRAPIPVMGPFAPLAKLAINKIEAGDVLVRIDPRTFYERVRQARNRLDEDYIQLKQLAQEESNSRRMMERTSADYATYQSEYQRILRLKQQNAATSSQVSDAEIQLRRYEVALLQEKDRLNLMPIERERVREAIETHRNDLELAELDLDRTIVRPPFNGQISEVMVERGQYLRVGDPLVRITDVSTVEVPLSVSLSDVTAIAEQIRDGAEVKVELAESTTSSPRWFGTISRISPRVDELTRTVMVYALVHNGDVSETPQSPLLPGAFVHARIRGAVIPDAIAVPRDAILNGNMFVVEDPQDSGNTGGKDENGADTPTGPYAVRKRVRILKKLNSIALLANENYDDTVNDAGDSVVMTNLDIIHSGARVASQTEHSLDEELDRQHVKTLRRLDR